MRAFVNGDQAPEPKLREREKVMGTTLAYRRDNRIRYEVGPFLSLAAPVALLTLFALPFLSLREQLVAPNSCAG